MAKSFMKNWLNLKKNLADFNNNISIYIPIYWIFYRKRSIDGNNSESEDKPNSTDNPGSNSPPKRPKTNCWPQFLRDCTILWQQSSMAISRKKIFMKTALFIWWYKNKIRNIKTLISGDKKAECDPHKLVYKKEEDRNHVC